MSFHLLTSGFLTCHINGIFLTWNLIYAHNDLSPKTYTIQNQSYSLYPNIADNTLDNHQSTSVSIGVNISKAFSMIDKGLIHDRFRTISIKLRSGYDTVTEKLLILEV